MSIQGDREKGGRYVNGSGYRDPVMGAALCEIDYEERQKRRAAEPVSRPRTQVVHYATPEPPRADSAKDVKKARQVVAAINQLCALAGMKLLEIRLMDGENAWSLHDLTGKKE